MMPFGDPPRSSQLLSALEGSDSFGSRALGASSVPCKETAKLALEAMVVDEFGRTLSGYEVALVRGESAYRLPTSEFGAVRFEGLDDTSYELCLVGNDRDAWNIVEAASLGERKESSYNAAWGAPLSADDFKGWDYAVRAGEGIDKIALHTGHLPDTIARANDVFLGQRQSRNVLAPGDPLIIPDRRPKTEPVTPGNRYVLRRLGAKARLRLRVQLAFDPIDGAPYLMELSNGEVHDGTTREGYILHDVPAEIEWVKLSVKDLPRDIFLPLDTLVPIQTDEGVRQRLVNLGIPCDDKDPRPAIRRFQQSAFLDPTGVVDRALLNALYSLHDRG